MRASPLCLRVCVLAFAATLGAAPGLAAGQPAPAVAPSGDEADGYFRAGKEAAAAGKLEEARAQYLKAWGLRKAFDIAANLGDVENALGAYADAAEHFAYSERHFPAAVGTPAQREAVAKGLAEAKSHVGTLRVTASVVGARIAVGDRNVGVAPLDGDVYVAPGEVRVTALHDGYRSEVQSLTVGAGSEHDVALTLEAVTGAAGGPSVAALVAAGLLGASGVAIGVGLAVVAGSRGREADDGVAALIALRGPDPCHGASTGDASCADIDRLLGERDALSTGAVVAFSVGGAAAIATLIYGITAPAESSAATVRIAPGPTLAGAGLGIEF